MSTAARDVLDDDPSATCPRNVYIQNFDVNDRQKNDLDWCVHNIPPTGCARSGPLPSLKRIEQLHPEALDVPGVARHHRELMHGGDRRDHGVLVGGVGLAVHQACPAEAGRAIHRQDVEALAHLNQPGFEIPGLVRILFTGELNARLNLGYPKDTSPLQRHHAPAPSLAPCWYEPVAAGFRKLRLG